MSRGRRVGAVLGGVLALLILAAGYVWWTVFAGQSPIVDGDGPIPEVRTVAMGFVSAFIAHSGPLTGDAAALLRAAH